MKMKLHAELIFALRLVLKQRHKRTRKWPIFTVVLSYLAYEYKRGLIYATKAVVFIKTRSHAASLPFKGQVTEQDTYTHTKERQIKQTLLNSKNTLFPILQQNNTLSLSRIVFLCMQCSNLEETKTECYV